MRGGMKTALRIFAVAGGVCISSCALLFLSMDDQEYLFLGKLNEKSIYKFEVPQSRFRDIRMRLPIMRKKEQLGDGLLMSCSGKAKLVYEKNENTISFNAIELRKIHVPAGAEHDYVEYSMSFVKDGTRLQFVDSDFLFKHKFDALFVFESMPPINGALWLRYRQAYGMLIFQRVFGRVERASRKVVSVFCN
jgi:hypothetical protein